MKTARFSEGKFLCALFCAVYFASYITRINYSAVITEIVRDLSITKELASLAATGAFVTYGAGQAISGWLGDRVPPKYIITVGLCGTGLCNVLVSMQSNPIVIAGIWCFNGFFQALIWPPLIRIIAETMSGDDYWRTTIKVFAYASVGQILVYLAAPLLIGLGGWRLVLQVPAAVALTIAAVWQKVVKAGRTARAVLPAEKDAAEESVENISTREVFRRSGMPLIWLGAVLLGLLRDGIITWMPSYINENFNLGTGVSILSAAVLPVFSILCVNLSAKIYVWNKRDELKSATFFFGLCTAACVLLYLCFGSVLISIVLMATICGSCHGVNQMLSSNSPVRFARYGCVSTMSGVVNAFVYLGSALSAYGFAVVAERWGWKQLVLVWIVCGAIGCAACFSNQKRWKKFIS